MLRCSPRRPSQSTPKGRTSMTSNDTSTMLAQLRTVLDLTNTEIQVAETRLSQARTDAVRRELSQNAANGRARAEAIDARVCGRVPGRDSPGRDVPTGDARRTGGGDRMAANCRHPGAGRCDQSCRPRDRRNWRPRASFFLPVLGFVLVDDPGCPAATASGLQLVFGGALPACCVVNGFVNETRRNCRDGVRRGAMAGMGD
jgi:hypothetical protein